LSICLLFTLVQAYGQDIITRTDGVVLKVTVQEVTPQLIRFRMFGATDALVYQISTADVRTLQRTDGTVQTFAPMVVEQPVAPSFAYESGLGRNIVSFYPLDLLYGNLSLAYEYILSAGKVGIKIPLTAKVGQSREWYGNDFRRNTIYGLGLEVNLYPNRQGKFRYFFAPSFLYRAYDAYYYDYYGGTNEPESATASVFSVAAKTGVYYHLGRSFLFSADLGLGFRFFNFPKEDMYYEYERNPRFHIPGNLHLGFRF
jgi:hypothetical protein